MKKLLIALFALIIGLFSFAQDKNAPIGYASQNGGTTGGGNATPVVVTTLSELKSYIVSSSNVDPAVIYIKGTLTNTDKIAFKASNKTIIGLPGAKLVSTGTEKSQSGIFSMSGAKNIIIRNLVFEGPGSHDVDGRDLLTIDNSTNIWIDHCEFSDGVDGNFDIKNMSDYITVSWCKFYYTSVSQGHRYCNLVGSSDSATGDDGHLLITFVNNWWGDGCVERLPRVRYGHVHVANNYYSPGSVNKLGITPGVSARVRVEKNYFYEVKNPLDDDSGKRNSKTVLADIDNIFDNCSGDKWSNSSYAFTPPYTLDLLNPEDVPSVVQSCAGATLDESLIGSCMGGKTYSLATTVSGNGKVSPESGTYPEGTSVTLTAVPDYGYMFDGWSGDASGKAMSAIVTMDSEKIVVAKFIEAPEYNVAISTQGLGIVDPAVTEPVFSGQELTITAYEYIGAKFTGWTGDITSSDAQQIFTVNGDMSMVANFSSISEPNVFEFEDGSWEEGIAAFEDEHLGFSGLGYVNTVNSTDTWTEITVYAPKTGDYAAEMFYAVQDNDRGNITIENKNSSNNTNINVSATGSWDTWGSYTFTLPLVKGENVLRFVGTESKGCPNLDRLEVKGDIAVTYSLTITQSEGGTISPQSGDYLEGTTVELSATPSVGYVFNGWTGDVSGTASPVDLTMTSDKAVGAIFEKASEKTISLKKGWNLVGCPLAESPSVKDALQSIWSNVEVVKDMDGFYDAGVEPVYNSLTNLYWGRGYFLKVSADCELTW